VPPSGEGGTFTEKEREIIAEKVAIGAVKYSLLKQSARRHIAFALKESVALAGNSGPYLQYTYARAQSVLRKAGRMKIDFGRRKLEAQVSSFEHLASEELAVLRALPHFPEVVAEAAQNYAPHQVADYLYDLAQKFNLFYNNVPILPKELLTTNHQPLTTNWRLALTAATAQILKNGLYFLGIEVLERM
jgi:arginyl-tRNA synthetase